MDREDLVEMIAKFIEEASDTDNNREVLMAGRHYPSVQEFASAIPNHLLLGSLLEHLCFVYETNPARSRTLFKVIGQPISDEFSTVRLQHNRAFTELLHAASSSLYPQGQQGLGSNTHNPSVRPKEGLFQAQTSRYLVNLKKCFGSEREHMEMFLRLRTNWMDNIML
ncbi:hypothetical protein KUCAC02_027297 [Chaenocephalus aceratus]|uniref:Uncharacterized protein n=1 Tax=Chaenocephalus aceratus TaxID=36190 RepID=A0ACB9W356_CHAAC|nr:hypothetical protein KUCAC02_027297 [Chaenocephalus aceratus]